MAETKYNELQKDIETLYKLCIEWIDNRQQVLKELTKLADELKEHQKNVNIAKVTGSSAAVVGAGLMIGGFAASFFTFGASLLVSAVGAGISGAGGATTGGAGIAKYFLDKKIYQKVQQSINRDEEITRNLQSHLDKLKLDVEFLKINNKLSEPSIPVKTGLKTIKCLGKDILYNSIQAAKALKKPSKAITFGADAGASVFKSLSTVGRAFRIGGFVVGAVLLPFDIYTLVKSSIELHEGNASEAEKKIREVVETTTCPDKDKIREIIQAHVTKLLAAD